VSDIAAAAKVFRDVGRGGVIPTVAPKVKFYIAAASPLEQQSAEETSDWQVLDAGAQPLPSGCIPCIGLEEPGEAGISAREGDFKGRMGTDVRAQRLWP